MNIMILGMQGAGKTVFISQFYYYANLKECDFSSGQYVARIRDILSRQEWPESTKQGNPVSLHFEMPSSSKEKINLDFADFAGQDIQDYFCMDKNTQKTQEQKEFSKALEQADKIIFLFDLKACMQKDSYTEKQIDRWMFKQVKKYCNEIRHIPLLILLSKADEFPEIPVSDYEDSRKILQYMKEKLSRTDFNWDLPKISFTVFYRAVCSVETEIQTTEKGPVLKPKCPLQGHGLLAVKHFTDPQLLPYTYRIYLWVVSFVKGFIWFVRILLLIISAIVILIGIAGTFCTCIKEGPASAWRSLLPGGQRQRQIYRFK